MTIIRIICTIAFTLFLATQWSLGSNFGPASLMDCDQPKGLVVFFDSFVTFGF